MGPEFFHPAISLGCAALTIVVAALALSGRLRAARLGTTAGIGLAVSGFALAPQGAFLWGVLIVGGLGIFMALRTFGRTQAA